MNIFQIRITPGSDMNSFAAPTVKTMNIQIMTWRYDFVYLVFLVFSLQPTHKNIPPNAITPHLYTGVVKLTRLSTLYITRIDRY